MPGRTRVIRSISLLVLITALSFLPRPAPADPRHVEPKPWQPELPDRSFSGTPGFNTGCTGGLRVPCDAIATPSNIAGAGYHGWFTFEAEQGSLLTVGTAPTRIGDDTDTFVSLIADDCSTVLASDDDQGPGRYSLIYRFEAPYTGRYHLDVRGFGSWDRGWYSAYFQCGPPLVPEENDRCAGAIVLPRCEEQRITGDLYDAGNDYDLDVPGPSCTGFPSDGRDVAYALDVREGDVVHLNYELPRDDASMYIVTDCDNVSGTCLASADRGLNGAAETLDWEAPATGRYYLVLDSYGLSAGGEFTLELTMDCVAVTGACCALDASCVVATREECSEQEGATYLGDDTACTPLACSTPVPVRAMTWGALKQEYR